MVRLLRDNDIAPTVIELNMAAGIAQAGTIILGSAGMANSAEVIRTARGLNPHVRVPARGSFLRDVPALKDAGANSVYSGEGAVALAFIEDILDSLYRNR